MRLTLLDEDRKRDADYIDECEVTPLAILTGCAYDEDDEEDIVLSGDYFLKTPDRDGGVKFYCSREGIDDAYCTNNDNGIRPVLENIDTFDDIIKNKRVNDDNEYEVEFGIYPNCLPSESLSNKLSSMKSRKELKKVGKNSLSNIYEYEGVLYSPITANDKFFINDASGKEREILNDQEVWLELTPVVWLVDEKNRRLISKKILIAGVKFDDFLDSYEGDFEQTALYKYLNEVMLEDLILFENKKQKIANLYKLKVDESKQEDEIRDLISSGIFVGLNGEFSEEKKEILSSIDPNYISLMYFSSVVKEDDFINRFKAKCLRQPNNIHIINLESDDPVLANALNTVEVEIGDVKNYCITNTFHNSYCTDIFVSIDVKSKVPRILKRLVNLKIHPLIHSLVLYLGEEKISKLVSISELEKASILLKNTGNLNAVRHILGDELTNILISLANQNVISLDDILNRNYFDSVFEMSSEEKSLLIPFLAQVDEKNIEVVRNFIIRLDDKSLIDIFDYLWSSNSKERKEIISNLNMTNSNMHLRRKRG